MPKDSEDVQVPLKVKIVVTDKKSGKKFNEIFGTFQSEESLRSWCENQSKGLFQYNPGDTSNESKISREDNGRTRNSSSKGKSPTSNGTRKRRSKKTKG